MYKIDSTGGYSGYYDDDAGVCYPETPGQTSTPAPVAAPASSGGSSEQSWFHDPEASWRSYCPHDVCPAAACGMDYGLKGNCPYAAQGIGACGYDMCGGAATGVGLCPAAVSGGSICAGDVCGGAAAGVSACGAAAGGVTGCGADAGLITGCAADICGGAACAIEVEPADACLFDACPVAVLPIVPFI